MRRLFIRLLTGIMMTGIAFILLFTLLTLIFPLRDRVEYSTVVLDDQGVVIHAFLTRDQQWRMKIVPGEISPLSEKTILAKEDKYAGLLITGFINPLMRGPASFLFRMRTR
ncbi:MAG: hypothetical protein Q8918_01695 [Bacteroidota bacterium]|nr:hypothetical protein [Bacteroidota bacterium]MDP4212470.1 hypothetical protein [Bacteroidota bacterium]MDP4248802.1 hypothetical protein [Bacteroidota bacterium]